jgi:hypothetical protein
LSANLQGKIAGKSKNVRDFRQKDNMLCVRGGLKRFYHALALSRLQALSQKSTQGLKKKSAKKAKAA